MSASSRHWSAVDGRDALGVVSRRTTRAGYDGRRSARLEGRQWRPLSVHSATHHGRVPARRGSWSSQPRRYRVDTAYGHPRLGPRRRRTLSL